MVTVVLIVVVVAELLFVVVMSAVCVQIKGRGIWVSTVLYHLHSDFCLQLSCCLRGFVVPFPLYLSCNCECKPLGVCMLLGILGAVLTVAFGNVIVEVCLLLWSCGCM